jgi:hypothetical protein
MLFAVSHSGSVRALRTARYFRAVFLVWCALVSGAVSNKAPVCIMTDPLHDFRYFARYLLLQISYPDFIKVCYSLSRLQVFTTSQPPPLALTQDKIFF